MLSLVLPFIRSNWKLIGVAGAIILLGLYISIIKAERNAARRDSARIQAEYDLYKTSTEAEAAKMLLVARQKENEQQEITHNTAVAYSEAMERQDAYYKSHPNTVVKRVPVSTGDGSGQVSCITPSAQRVNEASSEPEASSAGESSEVREEDCAADAANLLWLQDWAKKQGMAP